MNPAVNDRNVSCAYSLTGISKTCHAMPRTAQRSWCRGRRRKYVCFVSEEEGGNINIQVQTVPVDIFRRVTGLSIGLAVLMIVLGFVAMFKPFAAGVGICQVPAGFL